MREGNHHGPTMSESGTSGLSESARSANIPTGSDNSTRNATGLEQRSPTPSGTKNSPGNPARSVEQERLRPTIPTTPNPSTSLGSATSTTERPKAVSAYPSEEKPRNVLAYPSRLSDEELDRARPGPMDPPCEPGECVLCDERIRRRELAQARAAIDASTPEAQDDYGDLPF